MGCKKNKRIVASVATVFQCTIPKKYYVYIIHKDFQRSFTKFYKINSTLS